jgi:hypothetical protein
VKSGVVTAEECLHYVMSLPVHVMIVGCDTFPYLEEALAAANSFRPFTAEQREALLRKTGKADKGGKFEPFKTTSEFDATKRNRHWLGL